MPGGFFENLLRKFRGGTPDLNEIEEALLRAELGVAVTTRIVEALRKLPAESPPSALIESARALVREVFNGGTAPDLSPFPDRPHVILITGVNGVGKTSCVAKIAHRLRAQHHSVMLAAADTFRAGAIEQIAVWADRLGVPFAASKYGADPAAVCFDAWQSARRKQIQYLLCDTAGRLHTKDNLMQQLAKVVRALARNDATAPHTSFLVVDGGTGGNAVVQAREFKAAIPLSGIIMTKLDGSGRGGALVGIKEATGLDPAFITTGEALDQMQPFNADRFISELL